MDHLINLSERVRNTGIYVVQVFVSPSSTKVWRPVRELKGYSKVWLLPGEAKTVDIVVKARDALSYWDEGTKQ
jgi:beta-glucosidase